jgi:hypothetical protein
MMRWAGYAACMGMKNGHILIEKTEGKTPFRRPRCRWEENIKMNLKETEYYCV